MKAADEIFYSGSYSQNVIDLQAFDEAHAFGKSIKPDWFNKGKEPKSLPGKNKGLYLMLDAHSDKLASGSVDTDFQGFIGLIHSSGSFPLVSQFGFQIAAGSNNMVAVSAMKIDANENIRSIEVERRKCRFPGTNFKTCLYHFHTINTFVIAIYMQYRIDIV